MSLGVSTSTTSPGGTVIINTPIYLSGSFGGIATGTSAAPFYQWYPNTIPNTTTAPFIFPSPLDKKILNTGIDYIDYETIYRVKKGGIYKLYDWFIYEKMKLEGKIKEVD